MLLSRFCLVFSVFTMMHLGEALFLFVIELLGYVDQHLSSDSGSFLLVFHVYLLLLPLVSSHPVLSCCICWCAGQHLPSS